MFLIAWGPCIVWQKLHGNGVAGKCTVFQWRSLVSTSPDTTRQEQMTCRLRLVSPSISISTNSPAIDTYASLLLLELMRIVPTNRFPACFRQKIATENLRINLLTAYLDTSNEFRPQEVLLKMWWAFCRTTTLSVA